MTPNDYMIPLTIKSGLPYIEQFYPSDHQIATITREEVMTSDIEYNLTLHTWFVVQPHILQVEKLDFLGQNKWWIIAPKTQMETVCNYLNTTVATKMALFNPHLHYYTPQPHPNYQ